MAERQPAAVILSFGGTEASLRAADIPEVTACQ